MLLVVVHGELEYSGGQRVQHRHDGRHGPAVPHVCGLLGRIGVVQSRDQERRLALGPGEPRADAAGACMFRSNIEHASTRAHQGGFRSSVELTEPCNGDGVRTFGAVQLPQMVARWQRPDCPLLRHIPNKALGIQKKGDGQTMSASAAVAHVNATAGVAFMILAAAQSLPSQMLALSDRKRTCQWLATSLSACDRRSSWVKYWRRRAFCECSAGDPVLQTPTTRERAGSC